MSLVYCVKENKPCVRWVEKYFRDCLCNLNDDFSFGFGIMSLVFWGVAEIPQIITNFRTKSSHGVSLAFLLAWVAGDVCNLTGCILEPATLPTQLYTALLYTISTVLLVLQGLYYDHIYKRWKSRHSKSKQMDDDHDDDDDDDERTPLKPKSADTSIPIPMESIKASTRREHYYTSARSLASSGTSPFRTYLRAAQSGPSAMGLGNDSSSEDEPAPVTSETVAMSQPRPIPRSAVYGTFLAVSANFPVQSNALIGVITGFTSRRLLQEGSMEHSVIGQWLGWIMAAIYMSGRIPQIWLNIKRGSGEGLNPLMFLFAVLANVTYVLSILVRSTKWENLKANMAWLLDAVVCVALDVFIMLQYVYYRYGRKKSTDNGEDCNYGEYEEANNKA